MGKNTLSFLSLIAIGTQAAKATLGPMIGNNYYFRLFDHHTSFSGESSFVLARKIHENMLSSVQIEDELPPVEKAHKESTFSVIISSLVGFGSLRSLHKAREVAERHKREVKINSKVGLHPETSIVNLEFVDLDQFERLITVLTHSKYNYQIRSPANL